MSLVQINPKDYINKQVMIMPTSAVMEFYFRQVGTIAEVIECQGDVNFYRVQFPITDEASRQMRQGQLEVINSPYIKEFFGAFPTDANFLKFI